MTKGLKVWNGSAFVDGAPKVWNGSAFVDPASAWVWNGSAFVQVWTAFVFTPTLVTVSTTGTYSVDWPDGATKCDRVLCGAGGGGGGYSTIQSGHDGDSTTCSMTGVSTLTANGGPGGLHRSGLSAPTAGSSPGGKSYDAQSYPGGTGGSVTTGTGGNGSSPGAGGGGGTSGGVYGGLGGSAGTWAADTVDRPSGSPPLTGSVGAGGVGGLVVGASPAGGDGGSGRAFFYFYT